MPFPYFGDNGVMVALERTTVKTLGQTSAVMCEVTDCPQPAKFLFRTGAGTIKAYCPDHGRVAASELGTVLPNLARRSLAYLWKNSRDSRK